MTDVESPDLAWNPDGPARLKEPVGDARKRIQSLLDAHLDDEKIGELLDAALGVKKGIWVDIDCKHCDRAGKYLVQVVDPKTAIQTLEVLMNQGNGRPGEQKPSEQAIVVERRVIYAAADGSDSGD